jgi:hypothetical protein
MLPRDSANHRLQVANSLQMEDGAGTPVVSPKTGIDTTPQAFTVSDGAVAMVFSPSGDCRYGDNSFLDGSASGKGYRAGLADSEISYPCSGVSTIYVRAETGTISVSFHFEMLAPKE